MFDSGDTIWVCTDRKQFNRSHRRDEIPEGTNTQFCPNPIKGDRRLGDNVYKYHCLFTEIDEGSLDEQINFVKQYKNILTAVVFSGGKSLHLFTKVEPAFDTYDEWSEQQRRFIALFNGDTQGKDPNRLMRLPFTMRPETGKEQKLLWLNKKQ